MLILVAVTVSVALDGGLFGKSSNASNDTKEAVIREQLQDFILGKLDVQINTIDPELGTITLDGVTYTVTASELGDDIEITLKNNGDDKIKKLLKGELKINGVKLAQNSTPERITCATFSDGETSVTLTWEELKLVENGTKYDYDSTKLSDTSIGDYAFEGCMNIKDITIPENVTNIGYMSFSDCDNLTSVTIGNSVTSIGQFAFCDCEGLKSVVIGNSVTNIGQSAFNYCIGLTSIIYIGETYTSISNFSTDFANNGGNIGDYAFEDSGLSD